MEGELVVVWPGGCVCWSPWQYTSHCRFFSLKGFSCECVEGYYRQASSHHIQFNCLKCSENNVVRKKRRPLNPVVDHTHLFPAQITTSDGLFCLRCGTGTSFDSVTGQCTSCPTRTQIFGEMGKKGKKGKKSIILIFLIISGQPPCQPVRHWGAVLCFLSGGHVGGRHWVHMCELRNFGLLTVCKERKREKKQIIMLYWTFLARGIRRVPQSFAGSSVLPSSLIPLLHGQFWSCSGPVQGLWIQV